MLNRVMFIGHLGREPELRYTASGQAVCNFSVASTERWKKDGEAQERTEWLRCNAWDKLAEVCGEYLKKGSLVYVEGKLQTRQYEQDGVTKYATECRLDQMRMLGGRPDREESAAPAPRAAAPKPATAKQGGFDDMDNDIPF